MDSTFLQDHGVRIWDYTASIELSHFTDVKLVEKIVIDELRSRDAVAPTGSNDCELSSSSWTVLMRT